MTPHFFSCICPCGILSALRAICIVSWMWMTFRAPTRHCGPFFGPFWTFWGYLWTTKKRKKKQCPSSDNVVGTFERGGGYRRHHVGTIPEPGGGMRALNDIYDKNSKTGGVNPAPLCDLKDGRPRKNFWAFLPISDMPVQKRPLKFFESKIFLFLGQVQILVVVKNGVLHCFGRFS